MPALQIDTQLVKDLAGQVGTQHMNIHETLGELRRINNDLVNAWDGPAQNTFETTYGDWIRQLENYSETLQNVKGYLESVAQNFEDLDQAAQQAATGATLS